MRELLWKEEVVQIFNELCECEFEDSQNQDFLAEPRLDLEQLSKFYSETQQ